jgi:hypothetical protein
MRLIARLLLIAALVLGLVAAVAAAGGPLSVFRAPPKSSLPLKAYLARVEPQYPGFVHGLREALKTAPAGLDTVTLAGGAYVSLAADSVFISVSLSLAKKGGSGGAWLGACLGQPAVGGVLVWQCSGGMKGQGTEQ